MKHTPIQQIMDEVARAMHKFPTWPTDPIHAAAVLNEEVGELNKAILQAAYEPHKSSPKDVAEEAIQAAAMAIRFVASLDRYQYAQGVQHEQPELSVNGCDGLNPEAFRDVVEALEMAATADDYDAIEAAKYAAVAALAKARAV